MTRRPLDPRICNISVDANALDHDGSPKDALVDQFDALVTKEVLNVVVAGGVRGEVEHPHTPAQVQDAVLPRIFNLRPGLNASQQTERQKVLAIVKGNARPEAHAADASHLSEAAETGCAYFITHDRRILSKRHKLAPVLTLLSIVTLDEFFEIFDCHEAGGMI